MLATLREQLRVQRGRNPQPSAGISDAQSVKGADPAGRAIRGCYRPGLMAQRVPLRRRDCGTADVLAGKLPRRSGRGDRCVGMELTRANGPS
jgi:hypothetical protein